MCEIDISEFCNKCYEDEIGYSPLTTANYNGRYALIQEDGCCVEPCVSHCNNFCGFKNKIKTLYKEHLTIELSKLD